MLPSGMKFPNGIMPKGKGKRTALKLFIGMLILIGLLIWIDPLQASGYDPDPIEPPTIITNVSDTEMAAGFAMAFASGAHELDFSTQDWQLSVTYAMQIDEEEEDAYSIKLGKRWDNLRKHTGHC